MKATLLSFFFFFLPHGACGSSQGRHPTLSAAVTLTRCTTRELPATPLLGSSFLQDVDLAVCALVTSSSSCSFRFRCANGFQAGSPNVLHYFWSFPKLYPSVNSPFTKLSITHVGLPSVSHWSHNSDSLDPEQWYSTPVDYLLREQFGYLWVSQ